MYSVILVLIATVFGSALCNPTSKMTKSLSKSLQETIEDTHNKLDHGSEPLSEGVMEIATKVSDSMEEMLEKEFSTNFDAQVTEIDVNRCDRDVFKYMERKCDNAFSQKLNAAEHIKDESEQAETVCCAIEVFENCSLRAYDVANCATDKIFLRKELEAARQYYSVTFNFNCAKMRGPVLCESISQLTTNLSKPLEEITEKANKTFDHGSERLPEGIVEMDTKVSDSMEEMLYKEYSTDLDAQDDNTTELYFYGCNIGLLKKDMETKCDIVYHQVMTDAEKIEDEREKTETLYCAVQDYEKCILKVHEDANCDKDKTDVRGNFKSECLFHSVVDNITCTDFRDQRVLYTSAVSGYAISYSPTVMAVLILFAAFQP